MLVSILSDYVAMRGGEPSDYYETDTDTIEQCGRTAYYALPFKNFLKTLCSQHIVFEFLDVKI